MDSEWTLINFDIRRHNGKKYDTYYLCDYMAVHAYHKKNSIEKTIYVRKEINVTDKDKKRYGLYMNPNWGRPGENFNLKGNMTSEEIVEMLTRSKVYA
jgi:hypothetical protein